MSKDKDVDAVGACVGMKGMRVQSIIRELRGEKIDIIEIPRRSVTFAEKALQPAKVSGFTSSMPPTNISKSGRRHQLSLAIVKGQNVRLAAKLLAEDRYQSEEESARR